MVLRSCNPRRWLSALFVAALLGSGLMAQAQVIRTVAGKGVGDGGPATSAVLAAPFDVAADAAGNLYIADPHSARIRKVASNGIITTVAGSGSGGYSGDGGAANIAELAGPNGVAVDASGNLYISDSLNNRIRKVANSGTISTVAGNGTDGYSGDGGAATSAEISDPAGVAVDASGNLYIVDYGNNRIRKVTSDGIIITVAGNGNRGYSGDGEAATSAELAAPAGVAVDASGSLYIADSGNNRIRKVSSNGIITTVAGNGDCCYSGDGGPATSAALWLPRGVEVDASGNFYTADNYSHIRKVASNGIISTVAGNGTEGFSGDGGAATSAQLYYPHGVAVDAAGNRYIADKENSRIRKVATNGVISTFAGGYVGDGGAATDAGLSAPYGVAVDAASNLYIADSHNNRIRKVSTTGTITSVAGNGIYGHSGDGGPATSAALTEPSGVAADASGKLYIANYTSDRIRAVAANGIITTTAGGGNAFGDGGAATSAQLNYPFGVAVGVLGNLYIADSGNNRIRKVASNGIITTVAGNGTGGYSGDGSAATGAQLNNPLGVDADAFGNLYIADSGNNRVRKVASNGIITTVGGNGTGGYSGDGSAATSAQLSFPIGVAIDALGELYIADSGNNRIRKVASNGIITTVAGNGIGGYFGDGGVATSAQLSQPADVAVDALGNLYIADAGNGRIRVVMSTVIYKNGFE